MNKYINRDENNLVSPIYLDSHLKSNVRDYLIGDNKGLIGTILGFKKGWRKVNTMIEHYSYILYFSHETGRIERFLFNFGSKEEIIRNRFIPRSHILDTYVPYYQNSINKEVIISQRELENYLSPENFNSEDFANIIEKYPKTLLNFKLLNYGKLDTTFYKMFLLELCRDYFFLFSSRKATDLNLIRHFTKSLRIVNINNFIGYTTSY